MMTPPEADYPAVARNRRSVSLTTSSLEGHASSFLTVAEDGGHAPGADVN
jgi:hypothetical protein